MSGCKQDNLGCDKFTCRLSPHKCGLECQTIESICALCTKIKCTDKIRKEFIMKSLGGEDMDLEEETVKEILYLQKHTKDNVLDLRRERAAKTGIIETLLVKPRISRRGKLLATKCRAYEEIMKLMGLEFEPLPEPEDRRRY